MSESRPWEGRDNRMEQVAEALHEGWCDFRRDAGWKHGAERDDKLLLHPHLVPWAALDDPSRNQDRFQAAVLLVARRGDFSSRVSVREVHEAWRLWIVVHNGRHPHAKPYEVVHREGPSEHRRQAHRVNALFAAWAE